MSFSARFEWIYEHKGVTPNGLCAAAGVARSYLRNLKKAEEKGKKVRPGADVLDKFARAADVSEAWLRTGLGSPGRYTGPEAPVEPTPPTPPAHSHTRAQLTAERDDLEQIDAWFFEALQELGGRRYTAAQVRATKVFLATKGNPRLEDDSPRRLVLGALEAAKEIVGLGREPTPDAIFKLLIEKNAPPSGPASGAREHETAREFTKELLTKEIKKAEREGFRKKGGDQ